MRVRVIRKPAGVINGLKLNDFQSGRTYDVSSSLGDYLIVEGYARLEMRRGEQWEHPRVERRLTVR